MDRTVLDVLRCPRSGQRLRLVPLEEDGGRVVTGLLVSEAGRFPVLAGIPVLDEGYERATTLLEAGDFAAALAVAAAPRAGRDRIAPRIVAGMRRRLGMSQGVGGAPAVGATALRGLREVGRWLLDEATPIEILRRGYLESAAPMPDAYAYFAYRLSIPRHLVALSVLSALPDDGTALLDLGCGAGHMTWAARQLRPRSAVLGIDGSFFQLLAARRLVDRDTSLVCGDLASLPLASGSFPSAVSFDVFSFVTAKWAAAREAARVLNGAGRLAVTSVKNAEAQHVYAGLPLSMDGWRGLLDGLDGAVVADRDIVANYLDGRGLAADQAVSDRADEQLFTLLAGRDPWWPVTAQRFAEWPHAVGRLAVNPLYAVARADEASVTYERRFPTEVYAADNPQLADYLPERFNLPHDVLAEAAAGGRPPALDDAVGRLAVLAAPDGYVARRWPGSEPAVPSARSRTGEPVVDVPPRAGI